MNNNISFSYGKNPYDEECVTSINGQIIKFPCQNSKVICKEQEVLFSSYPDKNETPSKFIPMQEKTRLKIDKIPVKTYNNSKIKNCEENYMSIVGFFRCQDGVLAFGDTKGTILNNYHDKARGEIKKVFQNNYLMLVTYGNNKVKQENLEDILEKIVSKNVDLDGTMNEIRINIFEKSPSDYYFCFYDKCSGAIINYYKTKDGTFYSQIDNNFAYFGDIDYINYLNILTKHNVTHKKTANDEIVLLTVEEMKKRLEDALIFLIKTLDDTLSYNDVGLPILFEEYYY